MQASSGGGSSPLVPILIAIAALAGISIAAVIVRQRRHRNSPEPEGDTVQTKVVAGSVASYETVPARPNSEATVSGAAGQGSRSGR